MSEPDETTAAEPIAAQATVPDAAPEAVGKTQETTPFWKRWLGKS